MSERSETEPKATTDSPKTADEVAREVVDAFGIFNNPEGIAHFMRGPVRVSIEKALKAHGEAEYARGLEDAAQEAMRQADRKHGYDPSWAVVCEWVHDKIKALKPKEDGRG